jgi:hypothetical protein
LTDAVLQLEKERLSDTGTAQSRPVVAVELVVPQQRR